jgi:hypothetical protein
LATDGPSKISGRLRLKLAVNLKGRVGYDFRLPIGQIDDDIAVIEAGLDRLNAARGTEREGT